MPVYTTQELAELSGKKTKTIAAMASPSKRNLVRDNDGNFNTEHPKNLAFVQKHEGRSPDIEHEQKEEIKQEAKPRAQKNEQPKQQSKPQTSASQMMQVEYLTKKLNAEKLKEQIKTEQLKRERTEAKLLKREIVEELFRLHFNNVTSSFIDFVKAKSKFLMNMRGIDKEDVLQFEQDCYQDLEKNINTAKKNSSKDIDKFCAEYSKQARF